MLAAPFGARERRNDVLRNANTQVELTAHANPTEGPRYNIQKLPAAWRVARCFLPQLFHQRIQRGFRGTRLRFGQRRQRFIDRIQHLQEVLALGVEI